MTTWHYYAADGNNLCFTGNQVMASNCPSMITCIHCTFAYTGLCRQQQKRVEAAIEKAWDHGKSQIDSGIGVEQIL